jgi:flagellar basal-body rod protein FlgG
MLEGLYSAAAGMEAQQTQLDAVSNDLANLSTDGYKSERVAFSDLLYNTVDLAGTDTTTGAGAKSEVVGRSETEGSIVTTGDPLDIAIEGDGYLQVRRSDGQPALTRDGALSVGADGSLSTSTGERLEPPIKLPAGVKAQEVSIAADGTVTAQGKKLGQIKLVTVTSPEHLLSEGSSLLAASKASGPVHAADGLIRQGALEQSNVDIGRDMATMVSTERSYQLASTAIQTESQMMSIANELRTS